MTFEPAPDMPIVFRIADAPDLEAIVALLADDAIARTRRGFTEAATPEVRAAFAEIQRNPNDEIWVGVCGGQIVATLQLTILSGLSLNGMRRALVEGVRVRSDLRGRRIGLQLMQVAMERALERGCGLIQLSTDLRRVDAHRFYERLGFEASHAGMKRML